MSIMDYAFLWWSGFSFFLSLAIVPLLLLPVIFKLSFFSSY